MSERTPKDLANDLGRAQNAVRGRMGRQRVAAPDGVGQGARPAPGAERASGLSEDGNVSALVAELLPLIPKNRAYGDVALERDVRAALDLLRAGKLKRGDGAELTESEMRDEIRRSFSSLGRYDAAARDRVADRVIAWASEQRAVKTRTPEGNDVSKEVKNTGALPDSKGGATKDDEGAAAVDRVREAMTGDAHKQIDTFAKQQVGLDAQRQKDLANVMKRIYDKATDSAARRELKNTFGADMALSATEFIDQLRQQLVMELLNRVSVLERENKELGDRITRLEKLVGSGNGKNPDSSLDADTAARGGINIRFGDIGRFDNVANNNGGIPQQVGRGGYEQSYAGMPPANPGYQWQQIPIPGYMPPQGPSPRAEAAPAQTAAEQKAVVDKNLADAVKNVSPEVPPNPNAGIPQEPNWDALPQTQEVRLMQAAWRAREARREVAKAKGGDIYENFRTLNMSDVWKGYRESVPMWKRVLTYSAFIGAGALTAGTAGVMLAPALVGALPFTVPLVGGTISGGAVIASGIGGAIAGMVRRGLQFRWAGKKIDRANQYLDSSQRQGLRGTALAEMATGAFWGLVGGATVGVVLNYFHVPEMLSEKIKAFYTSATGPAVPDPAIMARLAAIDANVALNGNQLDAIQVMLDGLSHKVTSLEDAMTTLHDAVAVCSDPNLSPLADKLNTIIGLLDGLKLKGAPDTLILQTYNSIVQNNFNITDIHNYFSTIMPPPTGGSGSFAAAPPPPVGTPRFDADLTTTIADWHERIRDSLLSYTKGLDFSNNTNEGFRDVFFKAAQSLSDAKLISGGLLPENARILGDLLNIALYQNPTPHAAQAIAELGLPMTDTEWITGKSYDIGKLLAHKGFMTEFIAMLKGQTNFASGSLGGKDWVINFVQTLHDALKR